MEIIKLITRKLLTIITAGNTWMAITALSIAYFTTYFLNVKINMPIAIICSSLPFFIYTLNRFTDEEDKINIAERYEFFQRNAKIWVLSSFAMLIISLILAVFTNPLTFILTMISN